MKITITGISGFVGKNLALYLTKKGNEIVSLNLRNPDWKSEVDLSADVIIHLAGKAHDTKKTIHSEDYFRVNTELTARLFDVFLESASRDFIYFSSIKAVADCSDIVLTEEVAPHPTTPYGQSKLQAEHYLLSKKLPLGKRLFILRPCMIHGKDNKGNLNKLYQLVSKNIPWPFGAFDNKRSFCSITNVAYIINEIVNKQHIPQGTYNIADDEPIAVNNLIRLIAENTQKKHRIFAVPKKIIITLAQCGTIFHLPFTTEQLEKLTENFVVSNQKIKSALQIQTLPTTTQEGLLDTIIGLKQR